MKAGVVSVQGAVPEHLSILNAAFEKLGVSGKAVTVRREKDLESVHCLVIPGGESTTISRLLVRFGLFDRIVRMGREGVPIMGTCAGCILLAEEGDPEVERTDTRLLRLIKMQVNRNAFGRQRESFEARLRVKGLDEPFPAVFIRAPVITRVWGGCEPMAFWDDMAVMAKQDNLIALAFHPELARDPRIHEMLIKMV